MNQFNHGVLDDAGLHFLRNERWLCVPPRGTAHAGEVLALALEHELARIWLVPGSALSSALAADEANARAFVEAGRAAGWDIWATNDNAFISGRLRDRPEVQLGIPARSKRWNAFRECSDTIALYAAIKYLQDILKTPIEWGPGHVGLDLIKQVNQTPRRNAYIRLSESDLGLFMSYASEYHHSDLLWSRPLTDDERSCGWLHRYDKNNAYVAAAGGANLGAGEYVSQVRPTFDAKVPGLWHITLEGESAFNGRDLPHPTGMQTDSWQHTTMVHLSQQLGYQVTIREGIFFPEHHQTLRPWYELISQARQQFRTPGAFKNAQAQDVAYKALKHIYTGSLGKLAEQARAEKGDSLYRPDWWFGIVTLSKALIFLKIAELARSGYRPVAVQTDALYFVSKEADPLQAIPGLVTEEQGIGKFKYVDSFRLADIGPDVFTSSLGTLRKRLRELGAKEMGESG
ncbi:MAG TPA: hypothetical protein VKT82_07590 [Ktedonobacterales bacterium]|nr:hypothetical protein [Ktedonobacterales bacterium]